MGRIWLLLVLAAYPFHSSADYLSINFSQKSQIRTGLVWIQHKPELLYHKKYGRRGQKHEFHKNPSFAEVSTTSLPYTQVGKLFFKSGDDPRKIGSCTASFAGAEKVLVTAAHCTMTADGNWNRDFLFVLSYGTPHQKIYAVKCIAVPEKWGELAGDSILDVDFAMALTTKGSEQGILDLPGKWSPRMRIVGYSDNYFDGRRMLELGTPVFTSDGRFVSRLNPLGSGNSGSPWLDLSGKQVISVSSYIHKDKSNQMVGPMLPADVVDMVGYVNNECRPI